MLDSLKKYKIITVPTRINIDGKGYIEMSGGIERFFTKSDFNNEVKRVKKEIHENKKYADPKTFLVIPDPFLLDSGDFEFLIHTDFKKYFSNYKTF
jgi:hypothetical protein